MDDDDVVLDERESLGMPTCSILMGCNSEYLWDCVGGGGDVLLLVVV